MESISRVTQNTSSVIDPNTLEPGATAPPSVVSGHAPVRQEGSGTNHVEKFVSHGAQPQAQPKSRERGHREPSMTAGALAFAGKAPRTESEPSHAFLRPNGRPFPVSEDGTPLYNQSDRAWASTFLGNGPSPTKFSSEGCAVTTMAMMLSKLSGKTLTPEMLDEYLDNHGGYLKDKVTHQETNGLNWGKAGQAVHPPVNVERRWEMNLHDVNASLDAGRPVAMGVDFQRGPAYDHWVCLTRRDSEGTYYANDPAGGREIRFRLDGSGRLVEQQAGALKHKGEPYKSTGDCVMVVSP